MFYSTGPGIMAANQTVVYIVVASRALGMYSIYCTEAQGCEVRSINAMHPERANIPWAQLPWIHLEDKKSKERRTYLIQNGSMKSLSESALECRSNLGSTRD